MVRGSSAGSTLPIPVGLIIAMPAAFGACLTQRLISSARRPSLSLWTASSGSPWTARSSIFAGSASDNMYTASAMCKPSGMPSLLLFIVSWSRLRTNHLAARSPPRSAAVSKGFLTPPIAISARTESLFVSPHIAPVRSPGIFLIVYLPIHLLR